MLGERGAQRRQGLGDRKVGEVGEIGQVGAPGYSRPGR